MYFILYELGSLLFAPLALSIENQDSAAFIFAVYALPTWPLAGLFIGFAEETLTRGYVINLLRKAKHRELVVAVISSAIFAGLHAGNLLSGQSLFVTMFQLLYTFAFGICMYLALRATGNLIWPVLLHATTDPSIFLQTAHPTEGPLAAFAGLGNIAVILVGLVSVEETHDGGRSPSCASCPGRAPGWPLSCRKWYLLLRFVCHDAKVPIFWDADHWAGSNRR